MTIFENTQQASPRTRPLRVAILGCSGSIGTQALDVCRHHPDKLQVTALSVNTRVDRLVSAANEFGAMHVVVADKLRRNDPRLADLPRGCVCEFGEDAVTDLVRLDDVDCVLVAIVGSRVIYASKAALEEGKLVALANKESLVVGGELLMPLAKPGRLIPVDSEHSAIFQCLVGERRCDLSKIWLTCSGGPFFGMSREQLAKVTAAKALDHPTWKMGRKITIDCATLMNKGLEVIEAHHLFDVPVDDINVLIHRQSKIHSMVEFSDGSVKANIGPSDMRVPIQYAFSYPERWDAPGESLDFWDIGDFTFARPDLDAFRCLKIALDVGREGGTLPCAMNAANEVANHAFRRSRIGFLDMERIIDAVVSAHANSKVESIEQLHEIDRESRRLAREIVNREVR